MKHNDMVPVLRELVKQAELRHPRFCVGTHTHDDGQVEEVWAEWPDALRAAADALRAAADALAAQGEDTARLDWMEKQGNGQPWCARQSVVGRGFRLHNSERRADTHATARDAIDSARRAAEPSLAQHAELAHDDEPPARADQEATTTVAGAVSTPPVDRSARAMLSGRPETPDHRDIDPATGMQRDYVVLSAEERAKGFVRPVRQAYRHARCGAVTTMGRALAETYARDPGFYSGTFCATCRSHFPVGADGEFTWDGTDLKVGT